MSARSPTVLKTSAKKGFDPVRPTDPIDPPPVPGVPPLGLETPRPNRPPAGRRGPRVLPPLCQIDCPVPPRGSWRPRSRPTAARSARRHPSPCVCGLRVSVGPFARDRQHPNGSSVRRREAREDAEMPPIDRWRPPVRRGSAILGSIRIDSTAVSVRPRSLSVDGPSTRTESGSKPVHDSPDFAAPGSVRVRTDPPSARGGPLRARGRSPRNRRFFYYIYEIPSSQPPRIDTRPPVGDTCQKGRKEK